MLLNYHLHQTRWNRSVVLPELAGQQPWNDSLNSVAFMWTRCFLLWTKRNYACTHVGFLSQDWTSFNLDHITIYFILIAIHDLSSQTWTVISAHLVMSFRWTDGGDVVVPHCWSPLKLSCEDWRQQKDDCAAASSELSHMNKSSFVLIVTSLPALEKQYFQWVKAHRVEQWWNVPFGVLMLLEATF